MNKNTEKKAYVAPRMQVIKMDVSSPLLENSFYYQDSKQSKARAINNVNEGYTVVDFD